MIISAKGSHDVPASRFFNVFSANRPFKISAKSEGLALTTVKAGYSYDVSEYSIITIVNDGTDDLDISFEMSELKVVTGSNAGVEIVNNPTIEKINQPIAVTAQATVENGTVHVISGGVLNDATDVTVNAITKQKLLDANADRKKVIVQIISATRTDVRVGSVNVAAGRGMYLPGSKTSPGILEIDTSAEVYVFNEDAANQALVSVLEVLK